MSYVVLARKWRPQCFEEVVGQEHVTTTLKNAVRQNRTSHAYLFCGPRGIGKTTTARILAKALNCENGPTPEPCNQCALCREITQGRSLDVLEIDGASNRGIEEIRNLRGNVKFAPARGRFKIYIIDEVHMLTDPAFNALLKTLEEPPAHVKFIFATTAPHKVLPTIVSRCQRFDFRPISQADLVAKLRQIAGAEKVPVNEEALAAIARTADGSMRDAQSILDQLISYAEKEIELKDVRLILGMAEPEVFNLITRKIVEKDTSGALKLVDELISTGRDIPQLISGLRQHIRNLCVARIARESGAKAGGSGDRSSAGVSALELAKLLDLPEEERRELFRQAESFSPEDLFAIFQIISRSQYELKTAGSARITLEMLMIRLTRREKLTSLAEILSRLTKLEQNLDPGGSGSEEPFSAAGEKENASSPAPAVPAGKKEKTVSPPPPPPAGVKLDEVRANWARIVGRVKKLKISTGTYLGEGRPAAVEKGKIIVVFPQGYQFHKEVLEIEGNRKLLEKAAAEVLNAEIRFEFAIRENLPVEVPEFAEEEIPPEETEEADWPADAGRTVPEESSPSLSPESESIVNAARRIFKGKINRSGKKG